MRKIIYAFLFIFSLVFILILTESPSSPAFAQGVEPTPQPEPFSVSVPEPLQYDPVFRDPLYPIPRAVKANDHFYFIRPYQPDNDFWLNKAYRYGGINPISENPHTGIDIELLMNTPIVAAGSGTVVWAGYGLLSDDPNYEGDAYGLAVSIAHDFGYQGEPLFTIYAHNNKILVELGDHVEAGDLIALSGNTGFSTGPHTHFEIRIGENIMYEAYNPELWISPEIGNGVLLGRVTTTLGTHLFGHPILIHNLDTNEFLYSKTYSTMEFMNRDPYYKENFVYGDIPAGSYEIVIRYYGYDYYYFIDIIPGTLNYIRFEGIKGTHEDPPSTYTHSFFADR
jgi:hypothetical protein